MLQVDEAQACLKQAQEYWQSQQWQKTIEACAQALALNQKLPQAHKLMGDALQRIKKPKEAIGYYRAAIALEPNFVEVYANLGTLFAQQQHYQQAIDYYQQALKIDPNFTAVQKPLARAKLLLLQSSDRRVTSEDLNLTRSIQQGRDLEQKGELEAALKQYLQAAKLEPQRVETYREIIKLCEKLGLWADAVKYCRLVLRLTNGNSESVSSKMSQSVSQTVADNKVSSLDKYPPTGAIAVESKVAQPQNYLELGNTLVHQGNYNGAIDCYRRAIKQQPRSIEAYLALGELLLKGGQTKRVISLYLSALEQQPHPQLYFDLGKIYHGKQQWDKAALCYQKTLQLDGKQPQVCHELGEVLSQQKQWDKAIEAYRQAIELKTDFSWTYNNLGYALIQLNKWSQAIPAYRQAIKLKPDFAWSYYSLAEAYGKLDRWSQAIANYQQAAKLQPDLPQLQQKLGDAFYRRSQQDRLQALEHFRLAITQDPNNPEVYHQALAIDNRNLDLYLKLGDILANSGKQEQALITYQMALEIQPKNTEVLARIHQYQEKLNLPVMVDSDRDSTVLPTLNYEAFVAELEQILPHSDTPTVSIIIPVYNQLDYTLKCLKAIAVNLDKTLEVEIILVNDCSTDPTAKVLEPLRAVNLVNQTTNQGFIHSCNLGASLAKGEYIYFLNNDTEIKPNCIATLVEVLANDKKVGAVGSKLVYPQGSLQEAGGIVWSDASGWNYGRQDNPFAPEYNYRREVDYCSGASLMVRKDIFTRLNGFEKDFAPAYYEDTDLCFAIRHQLGMKVIYQPKSSVIHYEGISSGTNVTSGTKKYQVVNAVKFKQKWQANLERDNYLPNIGIDNVPASARKYLGKQTILVIDSYMPSYDRESGSRRLFELLKIFKGLGYHVIFAADNGVKLEPYASVLQNLEIEVLYTQDGYGKAIESQIESRLPLIDFAWICRPELNQKYAGLIRQQSVKLIYDTIDLHYLRLKRAWNLDPTHCNKETWVEMQAQELKMAHLADLTITVTKKEREILQAQGVDRVEVIPNIHSLVAEPVPEFDRREGILFIGSYNHDPNVDAVKWLCKEIMPLVWQVRPEIKVTLLGNKPTDEVLALQSDRIEVTGYVEDVSPYFLSHKLSVSPLRYGAGMKGKIGQSLEYSLPMVSTAIGTEGMNLIPEQQILEADNTLDFAQQIVRLYTNKNLWNLLSKNSQGAISNYSPQAVQLQIESIFQGFQTLQDNLKKSD